MKSDPLDVPEVQETTSRKVMCDGEGMGGHPRVWYVIGPEGFVECGYCDKRFVLKDGAGDH